MSDQFATWRRAVAGEQVALHDGEPAAGFYRARRKGEQASAVAYWYDTKNGSLRCHLNGADVDEQKARELWSYAAGEPISHEAYKLRLESGFWPDMDRAAAGSLPPNREIVGANNPPTDESEVLKEQIESAKGGAGDYAKIDSDEKQARAQSLRSRLLELSRTADKKREAEKKPHLDASKSVDAKWQPLVKMAKEAADSIARAMSGWETVKFQRAQEEQRKAEPAARKAEEEGKPVPAAAPTPPVTEPVRGAYGRAASVRQIKVVTITDQAKVYEVFKDRAEVQELLRKLAQRAVDDGYDVSGTSIEMQRKVS